MRGEGILIITPEGPLESADCEKRAGEVDLCIAEIGALNGLMIYTRAFPVVPR